MRAVTFQAPEQVRIEERPEPELQARDDAVVRIEGQFAVSISMLVGAPRLREDFVEVNGFWLPGHVRSVTSSFLLGPTELDIVFSNYQLDTDSASASPR